MSTPAHVSPIVAAAARILLVGGCLAGLVPGGGAVAADEPAAALQTLPGFLAEKGIDRAGRKAIEEATAWDDAVQQAALRVLLRIAAPPELAAQWRADAVASDAGAAEVADRLLAVRGRAVFVAPQPLTGEQRELAAGRDHFDVVRIVDAAGTAFDALMLQAPAAWPRGREIDEPRAGPRGEAPRRRAIPPDVTLEL